MSIQTYLYNIREKTGRLRRTSRGSPSSKACLRSR